MVNLTLGSLFFSSLVGFYCTDNLAKSVDKKNLEKIAIKIFQRLLCSHPEMTPRAKKQTVFHAH